MAPSRTIRTRYLMAGITICVASLLLVSLVSYVVSSRITAELSDTRIGELALFKAREFDTWFAIKEMILSGMAQDIEAAGDFSDHHMRVLTTNKMRLYAKEVQDFYVGYADRAGHVISGVGWVPPPDYDQRVRPWFIKAAATDAVVFTDPYVDAMTGKLIITVARALRRDGEVLAVLATDIFIGDIIRLVTSLRISANSYAMLLDEEGRVIAHPDPAFQPAPTGLKGPEAVPWPGLRTLVDTLHKGRFDKRIELVGPTGAKEYYMFRQMEKNRWFFGIAISRAQYTEPLRTLLFGFIAAFILSTVAGVVVMLRLVDTIVGPIKKLTGTVESFAGSDFTARADIGGEDEIGRLARSFNEMAATIALHSETLEEKVRERTRELEAKNTLIMDSIRYARRLQTAILPDLHRHAGLGAQGCFAIWRPRDTVGGDIYWCRSEGLRSLLVVADCTGHGVSGALMTMTINSILDATLRETGFASPAAVMELLHRRLQENLGQERLQPQIDDGADVAMVMIDRDSRQAIFCGAHLPIFIAGAGGASELHGDRHSIGYSRRRGLVSFTDIPIPWEEGLRIYITSDGLLDQHRHTHGAGMGRHGFLQLLRTTADLPLPEQGQRIEAEIDLRLAEVVQRDDICVLGFELRGNDEPALPRPS